MYNAEVDRFPHLVICTAIRALIVGGRQLWDRHDNGDNLLFRQADFLNPNQSKLLRELWPMSDPVVRTLTGRLVLASRGPLGQEPLITDLLGKGAPPLLTPVQKQQVNTALSSFGADPTASPSLRMATNPFLSATQITPTSTSRTVLPLWIQEQISQPTRIAPIVTPRTSLAPPEGIVPKVASQLNSFVTRAPRAFWASNNLKLGETFSNSQGQVFVYLPPGRFKMGSPKNETGRSYNEGMTGGHTVELTSGYFMAIHETTQSPYQNITGETPWKGQTYIREGADYPATYVSWYDANDKFIKRLNQTERAAGTLPPGWEYRLPTEAQWEYAARADTQTRFSFGDDATQLGKYAWFDKNAFETGEPYAHSVGQKLPNKWGLYDMAGNVWEWTADLYGNYSSGKTSTVKSGPYRVNRGGGYRNGSSVCRPTIRTGYSSDVRLSFLGFRLVLVQVSSQ